VDSYCARRGRRSLNRSAGHRIAAGAVGLLSAAVLSGCGIQIPTDPGGTLEEVRGGTLRVGISAEPELAEITDAGPSGALVDLIDGFAEGIEADVDWQIASEEHLVGLLEADRLDVAIGGFTTDTPWVDRVGTTREVGSLTGSEGRPVVILVEAGENAFLSELERYIDAEAGS